MKQYRFFYVLILFALIFVSCSKNDDPQYYSVLGTVFKTEDSTIVVSDEDEKLLVNNVGSMTNVDDEDRLIVYFSIAEETVPEGIDYLIDVYNYSEVLFKPVLEITAEMADSIGNDALQVKNLWLAKDYLNLNFEYYGNNETHFINLIRPDGEIPADTIELEIRHNNNDDDLNYLMNGFVSFDLKSLRNEAADSVVLHIKAKEYNSHVYDKYFTYKY